MIRRLTIGYRYWHMQRHRFGWRQVGGEMLCVMDDFGTLVPANPNSVLRPKENTPC